MSDIMEAAQELSEKVIDAGSAEAEDSQGSEDSGSKSNDQKMTLEERRKKMDELRKKMVRLPTTYPNVMLTVCLAYLCASESQAGRRREHESEGHRTRGCPVRTATTTGGDAPSESRCGRTRRGRGTEEELGVHY